MGGQNINSSQINHDKDKRRPTKGTAKTKIIHSEGLGSKTASEPESGATDTISQLDRINQIVFCQSENDYFPLVIKLSKLTSPIINVLSQNNVGAQEVFKLTSKPLADELIPQLLPLDPQLELDYSSFISHPGNLFVKNFSASKLNHAKMFKFFNNASQFNSLTELNIFNNNYVNNGNSINNEDESFAILKFNNYLDVEYLLTKKLNNPFHINHNTPLYLNKYISKKQRKLNNDEVDKFNNFNTIVVENLSRFFPRTHDLSVETILPFFEKFKIFGTILSLYFPVSVTRNDPKTQSPDFNVFDFGFIEFETNETANLNLLKCIYFLNNLTYEEFMNFNEDDIYNVYNDLNETEDAKDVTDDPADNDLIHISIAQHKHNHYLYHYNPSYLHYNNEMVSVNYLDMSFHSVLINKFLKYYNYQETNICVNNFPIVFNNDDELWESFWKRFGSIKLARIIKPQFYAKDNQTVGKIGFVFFKNFKMALKSIILTNNRLINTGNSSYLIKTSLAIQKLNKDKKKRFSDPSDYGVDYPSSGSYVFSQPPIPGNSIPSYSMPPPSFPQFLPPGSYYYYDRPDSNSLDGSDDDETNISPTSSQFSYHPASPTGTIPSKQMNHQMMPYLPIPQPMYGIPFMPYYTPFQSYNVPGK